MNTWPGCVRHAMHQSDHELWNARNYPGTRQLCAECEEPTGRCEEDSIYADDDREIGPLCVDCWRARPEYLSENTEGQTIHDNIIPELIRRREAKDRSREIITKLASKAKEDQP